MPKKGWTKGNDGKFHPPVEAVERDVTSHTLHPEWNKKWGFRPFGHRLDFLSPEVQHLNTGTLRILPPKGEHKRA